MSTATDREFAELVVSRANMLGHGSYSQAEWASMAVKLGYIVMRLTQPVKLLCAECGETFEEDEVPVPSRSIVGAPFVHEECA